MLVGHFTVEDAYQLALQLEQTGRQGNLSEAALVFKSLEIALKQLEETLTKTLASTVKEPKLEAVGAEA